MVDDATETSDGEHHVLELVMKTEDDPGTDAEMGGDDDHE
jgi:hypothetical protein